MIRVPDLRLVKGEPVGRVEYDIDDRLQRIQAEWRVAARRIGLRFSAPPFVVPKGTYTLWLPQAKQLMLIADDLARPTLRAADALDALVGQHLEGAHVGDLDEDVRVVIGLSNSRFYGLRGGALSVHSTLGLKQCRVCRHWWFLLEWAGWACRCCGAYSGNAGIAESFTDMVKLLPGKIAG